MTQKKTHNSEYGNNISETETRAVTEANKYRSSVGEKKRLAYDSKEFMENNPGKVSNPGEYDKVKKLQDKNKEEDLNRKKIDRQKRIERAQKAKKNKE